MFMVLLMTEYFYMVNEGSKLRKKLHSARLLSAICHLLSAI